MRKELAVAEDRQAELPKISHAEACERVVGAAAV